MWPVSKLFKPLLILWLTGMAMSLQAQQIVYDLRQDWVYYNKEYQGFLPVEEMNYQQKTINFALKNSEFDQFYLVIGVHHPAYLFYRTQLLASLPAGVSSFRIDSLKRVINDPSPLLAVYGNNLLPELRTEIRAAPAPHDLISAYQPLRFADHFSNYFYLVFTLLMVFFVVLKVRYPEMIGQYILLHRTFRIKIIDEPIYKTVYLGFPNNLFLVFLSMAMSLLLLSFLYFYPGKINIQELNPDPSSFNTLLLGWMKMFGVILVLFILKFFLTRALASVFDLKIGNIHYASSLRFAMVLVLLLLPLALFQVVFVQVIPETVFWIIIIVAMIIMEVILFFKLTLVSTHTLLYIIVYLCATEIIPIVFLYELVTL